MDDNIYRNVFCLGLFSFFLFPKLEVSTWKSSINGCKHKKAVALAIFLIAMLVFYGVYGQL